MDGKKGVPPDAAYVASRFALNGFFNVMRQELRKSGIYIGMIYPSRIGNLNCPRVTPKDSSKVMARAVVKMMEQRKK